MMAVAEDGWKSGTWSTPELSKPGARNRRSAAQPGRAGRHLSNRCCRKGWDGYRPDGLDAAASLLLEAVAREPLVERVFVNPAIKGALCREDGPEWAWMAKIRPWWGHNDHFHVRLSCPSGNPQCRAQHRRRQATATARSSIGGSP